MAAIAILDLLRKNPNFGLQTFSSKALFSNQLIGASTAAAVATPFAFGAFFGNDAVRVAYCDAGAALEDDYVSSLQTATRNIFQHDALKYTTKQYDIQMKPLLSAFHWKAFGLTSVRSFLLFYLPLLDPDARPTDDNDDGEHVDLREPFKKSVKQIIRETSVVTTRRGLERLAVHYASQRMAWKLLKDLPESATRKAGRAIPITTYFFRVSRTTFRGHFLAVLASWVVQVGINIYRFFSSINKPPEEDSDAVNPSECAKTLGKRICDITVGCGASLIFASIGAGIGATLFRPSTGQWIGCTVGDLAGPIVVAFCFDKLEFHCSCITYRCLLYFN